MEIEKMMGLREVLEGDEKKELDQAMTIVGETFKRMIFNVGEEIKGTSVKGNDIDFTSAKEALNTISALARKSKIDFPEFKTTEEVKVYILKYGMEIVRK